MQKITPFLWYNGNAEEAAKLYTSVFKDSKIKSPMYYNEAGPSPAGSVMSYTVELYGQEYILFNGGPMFTFSPAISLFVSCDSQEEIDELWEKLSEGGQKDRCGWVRDKFGVSWQIVPPVLGKMLQDEDKQKAKRVMDAMMQMDKIEIAALKKAYER